MKVVWSEVAAHDLDEQIRFIAQDSVEAALRIEDRIVERVASLAEHPESGRPGKVIGTRELVVTRTAFVAVYTLSNNEITIARVLHGAQRWPPKA
ncbi:MAG: type II toxin-antitoxin system RelE/ParE family toxin [Caulobacter sp.]|nr:type II toxin-antitoxin system RelE/ParE family toxin [Caulobacter sp.]